MLAIKFPHINFIGNRKVGFIISGSLTVLAFISIIAHGGFNSSVDFSGGTVVQLRFEKSVMNDMDKIRKIVGGMGYGEEVKTMGKEADNDIQISIKKKGELVADEVRAAIAQSYSENPFVVRSTEEVGPRVGKNLLRNAILAVILSSIIIILYMGIRFNLPFGISAVIALIHDVIMTLGALSLIDAEISLTSLAAILTILGYSLNDTIVVFDRVRENMGAKALKRSYEDKVNDSINETLSRTILTGGTTLMALTVMLIVFASNNATIRDFCVAMIVGIITGTYSSVFIASPAVVMWNKKWPIK